MSAQLQRANTRHWPDIASVLAYARQDIIDVAAEVGIDAAALLPLLPGTSIFLKGRDVPVLARRYQGCCSVRFYVNYTTAGQVWPIFRFYTFVRRQLCWPVILIVAEQRSAI